jgi:alpha-tubulin suppressor-like RCC1 family protein
VAWGRYDYDMLEVPAGNDYVAIACGYFFSLALKSDGSLVAWGANWSGECDVPLGNDFVAISAGSGHCLALRSDGTVAAWGSNNSGQCNIPAGNNYIAVTAGGYHSIALTSDGTVYARGSNINGQCNVPPGNLYVDIASGSNFVIALKTNGSLVAWGDNSDGQCNKPAGNDFTAIASGNLHSLALKSDGSILAWGANWSGQCNVPAGNEYTAIAAGGSHSLALKSDGSLVAWGANWYGQCNAPTGNDFVDIAAGSNHSLALKSDGSIVAWGANWYDQCNIPFGNNYTAITAGEEHSLALKSDGTLVACGNNDVGQCDVPLGNNYTSISSKYKHSLALKADGSLTAWGNNNFNQCNVPPGVLYSRISAGSDYSVAIIRNSPSLVIEPGVPTQINPPSNVLIASVVLETPGSTIFDIDYTVDNVSNLSHLPINHGLNNDNSYVIVLNAVAGTVDLNITVPVGAWWIAGYWQGSWHRGTPYPCSGPGVVTLSGIPFSTKGEVPVIISEGEGMDPTLPIELSSFTATVTASNFVSLNWVTQSETQVLGYNLYRSNDNIASHAIKINNAAIPASNTSQQQSYSFMDRDDIQVNHTYYYWLENVDINGFNNLHGPISVNVIGQTDNPQMVIPEVSLISSAYPNPFKAGSSTNIQVSIKANETGIVTIYNAKGQKVDSFKFKAGTHRLIWEAKVNASGIYLYKLMTPSANMTKKFIILN